jgi:hypothetical protein
MAVFNIKLTIAGLQEAQAANQRRIAMLQPDGELGEMVRDVTVDLQRYQIAITHIGRYRQAKSGRYYYSRDGGIGGGALRASSRVDVRGAVGRIYIDPDAVNPLTGRKPGEYGNYEAMRGGSHAFFARTVAERWPQSSEYGARLLIRLVNA